MDEIRKLINARRREFAKFDALPKAEQERLRAAGFDPHEPAAVRSRKRRAERERQKRAFDALPKERRAIMEKLGVSPYQDGQIICRSAEYYEKHGTYVIDDK